MAFPTCGMMLVSKIYWGFWVRDIQSVHGPNRFEYSLSSEVQAGSSGWLWCREGRFPEAISRVKIFISSSVVWDSEKPHVSLQSASPFKEFWQHHLLNVRAIQNLLLLKFLSMSCRPLGQQAEDGWTHPRTPTISLSQGRRVTWPAWVCQAKW